MIIWTTENILKLSISHVFKSFKSLKSKAISHMQFFLAENHLYGYDLGKERRESRGMSRRVDMSCRDDVEKLGHFQQGEIILDTILSQLPFFIPLWLPVLTPPVKIHAPVVMAALMSPFPKTCLSLGWSSKFCSPPCTEMRSLGSSSCHSLVIRCSKRSGFVSKDTRTY